MHSKLYLKFYQFASLCILFFLINSRSASSLLTIDRSAKPKFEHKDVTSPLLLENQKLRVFSDYAYSRDKSAMLRGNVFLVSEKAILNTESAYLDNAQHLIRSEDNLKIRSNDGIIVYAKGLEYNIKLHSGKLVKAQVFFVDNSSALMQNLIQIKEGRYEMHNVIFSQCNIANVEEISVERDRDAKDYDKHQTILEPIELNTVTKSSYSEASNEYKSMPISFHSDKMTIDREEDMLEMENVRMKIFDRTVMKKKYYRRRLSEDARAGFLIPRIVMRGAKQTGIRLPYYIPLDTNKDIVITPTFYTNYTLSGMARGNQKQSEHSNATMDERRIRANTLEAKYRHLFYAADEEQGRGSGMIKIHGSVTDNTPLVNASTRTAIKDGNGNVIYGRRWHIDTELDLGINKDTYVEGKFTKSSDPNYFLVYYMKYMLYSRNYLGIFKANETQYHGLEMMRFDRLLVSFSNVTTPRAIPFLNSIFEQKIDNVLGGRLLFSNKAAKLSRDSGFSSSFISNQTGYILPMKSKNNHYLTLQASSHFDSFKTSYSPVSEGDGYLGNYLGFSSNQVYDRYSRLRYYGANYDQLGFAPNAQRAYHNVSGDYSKPFFLGASNIGQFVLEPRIKYQDVGNANIPNLITEDSVSNILTRSNLFDNRSSGNYIIDSGRSLAYAGNAYAQFANGLKGVLTLGAFNYLGANNNYFYENYGLNKNFSDYVGSAKLYTKKFRITHEYRTSSVQNPLAFSGAWSGASSRTTSITLTPSDDFNIGISYSKIDIHSGSLEVMAPNIKYTFDNGFILGIDGAFITDKTITHPSFNNGVWAYRSAYILKQTNCIYYGINMMENNFGMPGTSSGKIFKLVLGVNNI